MARGRMKDVGKKKEEPEQTEEKLEEKTEENPAVVVEEKQQDEEMMEVQEGEKQDGEEEKQEGENGKLEGDEKKEQGEEKPKRGKKRKGGGKGKEKVASAAEAAPPRAKRARNAKPKAEPEYFSEKRNLEDLWKEVFPIGTEWHLLDSIYQYNWNFKNLEDAFEEGGELHGKRVYLFGCSEPQMVSFQDVQRISLIPIIIAVVSPFPPSDKVGVNSVQRETEEIVPLKKMKMDWIPYVSLENRETMAERLKSEIYILGCNQRRSALSHLKEERLKKFEYCLPYFYNPFVDDEIEQSTVVEIVYPLDPSPVVVDFDWEFDEVEEIADKVIEAEVLPADQKDGFMEFVKEKVREQKKANREARETRKKTVAEMSEETKAAYESMRFLKFYPVSSPDTPEVASKAPYINRYYGKAHQVL